MGMLKPANNRVDYGQLLSPPAGYSTAMAIGGTYSLDLSTLMEICLALGLSESLDSPLKENPMYLLEALRKVANKTLVFCEAGQIKEPDNPSKLHILLESVVVELALKEEKTFHPKFWLIKYEHEQKAPVYRCIVLSRNLTYDRSWDVAACLTGSRKDEPDSRSRPLRDFLLALQSWMEPNAKTAMVARFADEIDQVEFQLGHKAFTDFAFCPVGIDGYDIDKTGLLISYHRMLIVSPFLSKSIIDGFNKKALHHPEPNILITRYNELGKLTEASVSEFEIYTLRDSIIDGEQILDNEERGGGALQQDIHAKLYLRTKGTRSELFLGSLNASYNACRRNIEFMLKLYGTRRRLNVDDLKLELLGGEGEDQLFQQISLAGLESLPAQEDGNYLEKVIKKICRLESQALVLSRNGGYAVELAFPGYSAEDPQVRISPMLIDGYELDLAETIRFEGLELLQLSEFYIISVASGGPPLRRVIKIKTSNMPEGRESMVANGIIKNKHDFVDYINFILADDYLVAHLENEGLGSKFSFNSKASGATLYEKMLRTAVHSPGKLDEIREVLKLVSDADKIPEGFSELYELFSKVVRKNAK